MAQSQKVKLIIDTDGVSDDIRAISMAMKHPNVEVIAFTTVHGCVSVEQATANVARAQRACDATKIPIYKGSAESLLVKPRLPTEVFFFGKDGIGDQPKAFPEVQPEDFASHENEHAALALIRLTTEHPDATIVCLGPLTNIALAIKLDPTFTNRPRKMVIMGGNYYGIGNVDSKSSAEFNFHGDPEAASVVLNEMNTDITLVPWEAFFLEGPQHMKIVDFDGHLKHETPLASFLSTATSVGREILAKEGRQYSYCDEIAVATAINEPLVALKTRQLRVHVELHGQFTRGQVVVDWVDVLWQDDGFKAQSDKLIDRKNKLINFVTSYNVKVVDQWLHNAVQSVPGPW